MSPALTAVHQAASLHPDGITLDALTAATGLPDDVLADALHAGFHRQVLAVDDGRIVALPDLDEELP